MNLEVCIVNDRVVPNKLDDRALYQDFSTFFPKARRVEREDVINDFNSYDDMNMVKYCIKHTSRESHLLILKTTSVTTETPDTVNSFLQDIMKEKWWDVYFLCSWEDQCELWSNFRKVNINGTTEFRSKAPKGIQALMLTPESKKMILGAVPLRNGNYFTFTSKQQLTEQIYRGNLIAGCLTPNLFYFNMEIMELDDIHKANRCAKPNTRGTRSGSSVDYLWFILALIVIIGLAWLLVR